MVLSSEDTGSRTQAHVLAQAKMHLAFCALRGNNCMQVDALRKHATHFSGEAAMEKPQAAAAPANNGVVAPEVVGCHHAGQVQDVLGGAVLGGCGPVGLHAGRGGRLWVAAAASAVQERWCRSVLHLPRSQS
jgi:hypothetical protein